MIFIWIIVNKRTNISAAQIEINGVFGPNKLHPESCGLALIDPWIFRRQPFSMQCGLTALFRICRVLPMKPKSPSDVSSVRKVNTFYQVLFTKRFVLKRTKCTSDLSLENNAKWWMFRCFRNYTVAICALDCTVIFKRSECPWNYRNNAIIDLNELWICDNQLNSIELLIR